MAWVAGSGRGCRSPERRSETMAYSRRLERSKLQMVKRQLGHIIGHFHRDVVDPSATEMHETFELCMIQGDAFPLGKDARLSNLHEEEHVESSKPSGHHDQEIAGDDGLGVIADKRLPVLRRGPPVASSLRFARPTGAHYTRSNIDTHLP